MPAFPVQARDVCGAGDGPSCASRTDAVVVAVVLPNDTTKETKTPRDLRLWSNAKFVGDRLDRVLTAYGKPPTYHGDWIRQLYQDSQATTRNIVWGNRRSEARFHRNKSETAVAKLHYGCTATVWVCVRRSRAVVWSDQFRLPNAPLFRCGPATKVATYQGHHDRRGPDRKSGPSPRRLVVFRAASLVLASPVSRAPSESSAQNPHHA